MIFSNLFKTKVNWQHKDATTRITAINNELSLSNQEHLTILQGIVVNDDSDLVRRAALIKLNNFAAYLSASHDNSQDKVKQFAAEKVHQILSSDLDIELDDKEKQNLLAQQKQHPLLNSATLEAWFFHEKNSEIIIALYQELSLRKKSAQFLLQCFTQKQELRFKQYLINQIDDIKVLEKLIKKASEEQIRTDIEAKIDAIQAKLEEPIKVNKQAQLILAKLQALKDIADYGTYKQRKIKLLKEWQDVTAQFDLLNSDKVANYIGKQTAIMSHLDKLFVAKAENYQQQIIADKLAHDKQQDKKAFSQNLNQLNQSITTAVFSNENLNEALFHKQLSQLMDDIESSTLNKSEQQSFIAEVNQLTARLGKIPEIAECVSQATHLISKISHINLPSNLEEFNDKQLAYHNWLTSWKVVEQKTLGILPESIIESQKQIVSTWKHGLKPLQSQQKELFFQHKKKLQDIKRLLNIGKYKVCFGLFKGVTESISFLSAQQTLQLQRDFEQVEKRIAELSDWESYIATPRKHGLLKAIKGLVEKPLDNPNEQAVKVKEYRKTWNTLGHADESVDQALNEDFNKLCEQAFAPCRLFFAEQDKLREKHLKHRQSILVNAKQLVSTVKDSIASQTVDFKQCENQLNHIQQQWANGGEVDRVHYKNLQQEFREVIKPLKVAINDFHLNNVEQKNRLINQVEALLDNEDVYAAIESAKKLQQQWRSVGFAGKSQENILWQKFRTVNDQLFAKRSVLKSEEKSLLAAQQQNFETQLTALNDNLTAASSEQDKPTLLSLSSEVESLHQAVKQKAPSLRGVISKIERTKVLIEQKLSEIDKKFAQQSWSSLFTVLTEMITSQLTIEELKHNNTFNNLTNFWQKRLTEYSKVTHQAGIDERSSKTLVIEILSKSDSPASLAEQRMAVQVKLLQQQMLTGNDIDLSKELADWLLLGKLETADLPLLERLQKVFINP